MEGYLHFVCLHIWAKALISCMFGVFGVRLASAHDLYPVRRVGLGARMYI